VIRTILTIVTAACCATFLVLPAAAAAEKPKAASEEQFNPCDIYGPGFKPLGVGNVCLKLGVSVGFGVRASSGGHRSVAETSDWIKKKPAGSGN